MGRTAFCWLVLDEGEIYLYALESGDVEQWVIHQDTAQKVSVTTHMGSGVHSMVICDERASARARFSATIMESADWDMNNRRQGQAPNQ